MSGIFISYRRDDSAAYAGRLYDRLANHFGHNRIFMDIEHIEPGEDFTEVIQKQLAAVDVAIILIGKQWLDIADSTGQRRLDDPDDFVRLEIVAILERKIRAIPVLVGGAVMPKRSQLPDPLAPLIQRHALEVSDLRFHSDVETLIGTLERIVIGYNPPPKPPNKSSNSMTLIGAASVIALGGALYFGTQGSTNETNRFPPPPVTPSQAPENPMNGASVNLPREMETVAQAAVEAVSERTVTGNDIEEKTGVNGKPTPVKPAVKPSAKVSPAVPSGWTETATAAELEEAATQGDVDAQARLSALYSIGLGVKQDFVEALFWAKKAAEHNNARAQNILGMIYEGGEGVTKDLKAAVEWYWKSAEQGFALAHYNLGRMSQNGYGVPKDPKKAAEWYQKAQKLYLDAAAQNNAIAQHMLGVMYDAGAGVTKDDKKAVEWYRKAAEQGDTDAQYNLGVSYANGQGVPQDDKKAVEWYRKAAEQGYANAQYNLGVSYVNGRVPQDDKKAMEWFRKAADQGDASAQTYLGVMYANGQGVPQDDKKAVEWYRKAADQGNARAQTYLGFMYYSGKGVPQDDKKAVEWYRKAADQEHMGAQFILGVMYDNGKGVLQDDKKAVEWYRKAADQGHADAQAALRKKDKQ